MNSSSEVLRQKIEERWQNKKENKKTDWTQHLISILVGLAIVFLLGLIAVAYFYSDRVYNLKSGESLRLTRSEQSRIDPFLDASC